MAYFNSVSCCTQVRCNPGDACDTSTVCQFRLLAAIAAYQRCLWSKRSLLGCPYQLED